jgi:hypothetical protein
MADDTPRKPIDPTPPAGDPRWNEVVDRRTGIDRRAVEGAQDPTNLERRRGPGRRLTDFVKTAEEGEMNREQYLFLLEIIRKLGYRKTMPTELNLGPRAADWTEKPDAPAGVTKLADKRDE